MLKVTTRMVDAFDQIALSPSEAITLALWQIGKAKEGDAASVAESALAGVASRSVRLTNDADENSSKMAVIGDDADYPLATFVWTADDGALVCDMLDSDEESVHAITMTVADVTSVLGDFVGRRKG